jgi:hypothetical protein
LSRETHDRLAVRMRRPLSLIRIATRTEFVVAEVEIREEPS